MNCNLCKQELEAYHEGRLPEGIRVQVENHLRNCSACHNIYKMELLANRIISDEKETQSNPFLATRVMTEIEALKKLPIPAYKKILKPALISVSLAAAIFMGILAGNIYKPVSYSEKIPVELSYVNDAAIESVDLLSNNE
jgi:predicted anti-sigma-YlaC factor YlaD